MNRAEFGRLAPGQVLSLPEGIAFLPDELPPSLEIAPPMLRALGGARGALGEFVGEARLVENSDLITHPLAIREAVLSNKIEGTNTAIGDVLQQKAGAAPTDPEQLSNQEDVLNSFRALEVGAQRIAEGWPLNATLIGALHRQVLANNPEGRKAGIYRLGQVYIGRKHPDIEVALDHARYVPPPAEHVPAAMERFLAHLGRPPAYDPLIDAALLHYQFEAIHPFEDGNGRLGRLLIPLYLIANGLLDRPCLSLSSHFEKYQDDYVALMKGVSTQGRWIEWILYFLDAIEREARDARERVRKVLTLHANYRELVTRSSRSQAPLIAIDVLMSQVVVTARDIAEGCSCTDPTARSALEILASLGIVRAIPGRYPQAWIAQELLDEVYEDH